MVKRKVIFLTLLLLTLIPLITAHELCDNRISEDKLEIIEITDSTQTDETTWSWEQNDDIITNITIENKNFTERDFQLELFLLDEDLIAVNFTITNINPKQTISLDVNETKTLNLSFKLKELTHPFYYLYAKLTDENNESICTSLKATSTSEESKIEIVQEEKIIIVRKVEGPTNITAGSKVEYMVEVINFGSSTEDKVLVVVYNTNLKIREEREIENLEAEKSKTVTFNFTIPKNASLTKETFLFSTEYGYNEENGLYYQSSDKLKTFYTQIIQNQSIQTIPTQNETVQIENQTTNETAPIIQEKSSEASQIPYLWPIIITLLIIIIIIISMFLFLKYKKNNYVNNTSSSTPANAYVEKIQKEKKSPSKNKPTSEDKPSETNTENTNTLQTYEIPPQKPDSH